VGECGGSRKAGGAGGGGALKSGLKKGASGEVEAEEAAEINIGARWLTKLYSLASTASLSLPRRRKGLSRPKWWFALE
jgi:hypothetical protein